MEKESKPKFSIRPMQEADIDEATEMRLQSWLDTYPNDDYGVTREWVEQRNQIQRSDEVNAKRLEKFRQGRHNGTSNGWVARDNEGKIVGVTTPYVDNDGIQHVGSLYVDKTQHGTGLGSALMQKVVDWFDPSKPIVLGVVSYNERAKAFYRKWGFEEIPNSEELFDGLIPEVHMVRKGAK